MSVEVTVIVPVYNEEKYIKRCLESIIAQRFPAKKMEVLLIDGGSTDRTRTVLRNYEESYPFIRVLNNKKRYASNALNRGIAAARGEIIMRMDAHTVYPTDYIQRCIDTLHEVDADNVGGRIIPVPGAPTLTARAISFALSHVFGVGNSKFRTTRKAGYVDTVPFGTFKKSVFNKTGLFAEALVRNQDIELNSRIAAAGGKIYLNPEIKAYYFNRPTLKELWHQNFKNGEWNIYTSILNKKALSWRHFVPLLFIVSLACSALLSFFSPMFGIAFTAILASYFGCAMFATTSLTFRHGYRLFPVLPAVFATLHVSYGIGSLRGLMNASNWERERLKELRIKSLRSLQTTRTRHIKHAA